jgi:hypothetical protein
MFVRMPSGLSANLEVILTVEGDEGATPVRVRGRVVHALPGLGSGIEFVSPEWETQLGLAALIQRSSLRQASR